MRGKDFNAGLKGGLFEAQHYERMGAALWLYGWLILRQTRQEGTVGFVLGGKPVTYREIEEETGFARKTLERWMQVLRRNGYIETRVVTAGIIVKVTKAKEFISRVASNATQMNSTRNATTSNMEPVCPGTEETSPRICGPSQLNSTDRLRLAGGIRSGFVVGQKSVRTSRFEESQRFHSKSSEPAQSDSRDERCESAETTQGRYGCGSTRSWCYPRNGLASGHSAAAEAASVWRMLREEMIRRELRVGAGPEVHRVVKRADDFAAQAEERSEPRSAFDPERSVPPHTNRQGNLFGSPEGRAERRNGLDEVAGHKKAAGAA